jgi:hypothetical protein
MFELKPGSLEGKSEQQIPPAGMTTRKQGNWKKQIQGFFAPLRMTTFYDNVY